MNTNPMELETAPAQPLPVGRVTLAPINYESCLDRAIAAQSAAEVLDVLRRARMEDAAIAAEAAFNEALRLVQMALPPIEKDSLNPSTQSKYAKLEKLQRIIMPIAYEHGFCLSYGTDKSELTDHYGVTCIVSHNAGHSRTYRCDVPVDMFGPKGLPNKTRTHGFGSALSYGQRYLTALIFNVVIVGQDDDGNLGQRPKPPGPSAMGADVDVRPFAKELANLLRPILGDKPDWAKANEWLWRNDILDGAIPEEAPKLTAKRFIQVINKTKAVLNAP